MKSIVTSLFVIATIFPMQTALAELLTTTTENVGKPYDVLDAACVYQQFESFSFSGDPLPNAVNKAFEQVSKIAEKQGADAFVKFDVDFGNRTSKDEGRVLLCGTLVKFK